ncbi:hypothetical protein BRC94_00010 [Halobacteriales archaeon QS_5_70_17]|nr:MAG: hypothetical protein BRC94_00010 [Halobacteriales archaeon QS_5_70_17]
MIVGDPNLALASSRGLPIRAEIDRTDTARFEVSVHGYPTGQWGLGTIATPHIASNDRRYLHAGHMATYTVTGDQLSEYLRLEHFPVTVGSALRWSDEIRPSDLE